MSMSVATQPISHPPFSHPAIQPTNCQPLLDLAGAIVRKAMDARSVLWIEVDTERLMRMHPDCRMSRDEVRHLLARKAVEGHLDIAFG